MLRACKRTLKPGGVLSFLVIAMADGLAANDTTRAVEAGPDYVATTDGYPSLLDTAGFVDIEIDDVSNEYVDTMTDWIREWDKESDELVDLLGADEFSERQARRRHALGPITAGLLRRYMITASRPGADLPGR